MEIRDLIITPEDKLAQSDEMASLQDKQNGYFSTVHGPLRGPLANLGIRFVIAFSFRHSYLSCFPGWVVRVGRGLNISIPT